ncbi:hypothetical protein PMAYCL1PPCAC_01344, partial [Pristionchus mayeri]
SFLEDEESRKPFNCEECGKRFTSQQYLENHLITHLDKDDPRKKRSECKVCGRTLAGASSLSAHMQTHLDENDPEQAAKKRPFKCEECGIRFRNNANLRNHTKNAHSE